MKTFNNLPLLAMRGNFFFPNVKAKVEVARTISRNAVKFALENGGIFFMVSQVDATQTSPKELGDVYDVGVIAEVLAVEKDDEQSVIISVRTLEAAKISSFRLSTGIIFVDVNTLDFHCEEGNKTKALFKKTCDVARQYSEINSSINKLGIGELAKMQNIDYLLFTNLIANEVVTKLGPRQQILQETDLDERMEQLCVYMLTELDFATVEKRIANRVRKQVEAGQKEYYLREQIKAISAELGDDANEKQEYLQRIKNCHMPEEVQKKAEKELSRLNKMSSTSPDAAVHFPCFWMQ